MASTRSSIRSDKQMTGDHSSKNDKLWKVLSEHETSGGGRPAKKEGIIRVKSKQHKSRIFGRSLKLIGRLEMGALKLYGGKLADENDWTLVVQLSDAELSHNRNQHKFQLVYRDEMYELTSDKDNFELWLRAFHEHLWFSRNRPKSERSAVSLLQPVARSERMDHMQGVVIKAIAALNGTMTALDHMLEVCRHTKDRATTSDRLQSVTKSVKKSIMDTSRELSEVASGKCDSEPKPAVQEWRTSLEAVEQAASTSQMEPNVQELFLKGRKYHAKLDSLMPGGNEPQSWLQAYCCVLSYSYILDLAVRLSTPPERMEMVAAFVFAIQHDHNRLRKPFEPLLGETFEFDRMSDLGWRFHSEAVSREPAVIAAHTDGTGWSYWASGGSVLQVDVPRQIVAFDFRDSHGVLLKQHDELYQWSSVDLCMCNFGDQQQRYAAHRGQIAIKCSNGIFCWMNFEPAPSATEACRVSARVIQSVPEEGKQVLVSNLHGRCSCAGRSFFKTNSTSIAYLVYDFPTLRQNNYGFSSFDLTLNQMPDDGGVMLPPTDSRRRQDMRLLESGKLQECGKEAARIAKTQHKQLKSLRQHGNKFKPRWFTEIKDLSGKTVWLTNHRYWPSKKDRFRDEHFT